MSIYVWSFKLQGILIYRQIINITIIFLLLLFCILTMYLIGTKIQIFLKNIIKLIIFLRIYNISHMVTFSILALLLVKYSLFYKMGNSTLQFLITLSFIIWLYFFIFNKYYQDSSNKDFNFRTNFVANFSVEGVFFIFPKHSFVVTYILYMISLAIVLQVCERSGIYLSVNSDFWMKIGYSSSTGHMGGAYFAGSIDSPNFGDDFHRGMDKIFNSIAGTHKW